MTRTRRRAGDRRQEILAAALELFAARGYAAASMDEIAKRAGVAKGTPYLYFATKEALFRAVVSEAAAAHVAAIDSVLPQDESSFPETLGAVLDGFAELAARHPAGALARIVIGESRNFPELARVWHDEVAAGTIDRLAALIERAQGRGEAAPGEQRIHALSLIGPLLLGLLWREAIMPAGGLALNLHALAGQHAETLLHGLRGKREGSAATRSRR